MAGSSLKPMVTYTGLVDDFAKNHDDGCIQTLRELNEYLVSAVLVGHPLLINDGHVIMHPAIREAILKPESSPLRNLVATGYVKILTRNAGDLETLAAQMADEGITSAQRFSVQRDYAKSYLPALHVWMSQLRLGEPQSFLHPWPELNTTSIFHKITAAAYRSIRDVLVAAELRDELKALRRFRDLYELGRQHRRTDWENVANRMRGSGRLSETLYRELMYAGNEVYQYSWGCALARKDNLVRVETRAPKFTDLDMSIGETTGSYQDSVEVYSPNFTVAHRKIGDNWSRLAEVARPGTETYYAKVEFQRCMESYYHANGTEVDRSALDAAARKYSKALSDHFRRDERARLIYGYVTAAAGAAVGIPAAPLGPWLGTGIGLAVGVATVVADQVGAPRAMMKIMNRDNKKWITSNALGRRPTMVSNFQIDQMSADEYRRGVREFKQS
ncbi:hypothetical protein Prum_005690 [Phytohabitans rumicis]|uniref:Uncharacterized protein n=1 Tax=Phytohabitans rumicis TaxID=1076125 RepID=A0A6V8KYK9_9ACTN|nr:hypothetical protein Prum_005690 [Phytohabitans rumicis]